MENEIKVSIICSVRDRENYIEECVDSILAQTLKDIEIILIDNGCIDNCPRIIDEYAKKDNRIVAIHNDRNSTYGMALNQAAKIAKGEYIGIVESDDFIEPLMYEKLYENAKNKNADICAADANLYENEIKKFWGYIPPDIDENKTYTLIDYPKMLIQPWNMWAKIYKKELFQSVKFLEESTYIDFVFVPQAFAKAKKIAFLKEGFYNWRQEGNRSSNINLKNAQAFIKAYNELSSFLKKENLYDLCKEEMYYHAACPFMNYYRNLKKRERKIIFKDWRAFLGGLKDDKSFTYKYFKNDLKNHIQRVLKGDFKATLYSFFETKRVFGLPLIEKRGNFGKIKTCFCNIPVLVETKTPNRDKLKFLGVTLKDCGNSPDGSYKRRYLFGLLKSSVRGGEKNYFFAGIPLLKIKKNGVMDEFYLFNIKCGAKSNGNALLTRMQKFFDIQKSITEAAQIHPKTFLEYKNKYRGQNVVIAGCGPSALYYNQIPNAVHIAVNRAFKLQTVRFDYLFVQDFMDDEDMIAADNYLPEKCKKFYALIPDLRLKEVYPKIKRIPLWHILSAGAGEYILASNTGYEAPFEIIPSDIAYQPVADIGGTVFSAMQFALYTNPEKIYLVGIDCSFGHFHKEGKEGLGEDLSPQVSMWQRFKDYCLYMKIPTEIISVNPVGLKGMFKEVYTQSYVNEHPEILRENPNVEILTEKELIYV